MRQDYLDHKIKPKDLVLFFPPRDKVKDDSDIVKKEFASVLGQLVCTLHGKFYLTSSLTETLSEYGHIDLLCKSLKVASQPECSSSRLKASVCKPFLFLLKKKTPSPVKLGKWFVMIYLIF